MADNGVQRPPILDPTAQAILNALKDVSFRPLVIDNLTSSDTGSPLSANQGKVLKGLVDANTSAINAINTTITPIDVKSYLSSEVIPIFGRVINGVAYFCFYANLSISAGTFTNFYFLKETASAIYPKSNFPVVISRWDSPTSLTGVTGFTGQNNRNITVYGLPNESISNKQFGFLVIYPIVI